ncbi:hypothetical protein C8J55DRAFT_583900 [Lentinula edodes]|uniref:Uncharacterized protein n=1 Tax=Lentinula lateritia TaxID=40482 RepID=A0A9W8ZZY1_9AGAR|nr:hypothetical protein C8J55DRAFT_583900 [Lentinula edodes]
MIINAFGKLSVAPTNLTTGDRVLESAAGSAQFPSTHPSEIHFTVNPVVNLPNPDWTDTVSFAHQRLLVAAMNDTLWRSAVAELFRAIKPGGWVELVKIEAQDFSSWSVSPNSTRLASLINALRGGKGVTGDLPVYLPVMLCVEEKELPEIFQFIFDQCSAWRKRSYRRSSSLSPGNSQGGWGPEVKGYGSDMWRDLWMGTMGPVIRAGGYGVVDTVEEYEALV